MASIITLMDLTISVPDHTPVSHRAVTLPVLKAEAGAAGSVPCVDRQHWSADLPSEPMAASKT